MEKIPISYWGVHELEGVKFYLEPGTVDDDFCPFYPVRNIVECPHRGLSEKTTRNWYKAAYIRSDTMKADKCLEMVPEGLILDDKTFTFFHAKLMPGRSFLLKALRMTNALPVFIYGIDMGTDMDKLLPFTQLQDPRPIYFCGDPYVPVPPYIKII
nr:MAG TPA: hypothetical protein [Caudoviricetes sp.]